MSGPETLPLFGEPVAPGPLPDPVAPPTQPEPVSAAPPLTEALVVDPVAHAAEIKRFYRRVVIGPDEHCAIWTGAISNDGYGTFSITRDGRERTVKAHRFAVAYQLGVPVAFGQVIEHAACDNPICVRAHPDPAVGHLWPSTQADNLRRMAARGRGGGRPRWWIRRWSGLLRHERAERSRALAAAVRDRGWDETRVRAVLLTIDPAQMSLFP
ncbi:hypothetical protein [Saccharopolyspora taberi]|uniref:HNH endonuclease n=1 Tax=Saccharopolyspora taberi TaxID=60895 RepID=A0ABN3VGJ4_9PSEU